MPNAYEYSYEWDIRYCYENSNVLRNKLGIIDADALHVAEREIMRRYRETAGKRG